MANSLHPFISTACADIATEHVGMNLGPLPSEEGIRMYNKRLAQIYLDEESIGGLPMNMEDFHLFDENHRSSYPLCIAYKAAELASPQKAYAYLKRLRRATILESRQTTRREELITAAVEVGIDESDFLRHFDTGNAERSFSEDLALTRSIRILSLPSCIIECGGNLRLVNGMMGYDDFLSAINFIQQC